MIYDKKIKALSKSRFYQLEASHWLFSTRAVDVIILLSILSCLAISRNQATINYLDILCIGIALLMLLIRLSRLLLGDGFMMGYRLGFKDAASRHITFLKSEDPWRWEYDHRITRTLYEIDARKYKAPFIYRKTQNMQIYKGFNNASTWKSLFSIKKSSREFNTVKY
jgi:hypothetical protein